MQRLMRGFTGGRRECLDACIGEYNSLGDCLPSPRSCTALSGTQVGRAPGGRTLPAKTPRRFSANAPWLASGIDGESGFTLIEALTAIAIVLALAAVTMAAFANFRSYFALRVATHDVHTALIDARSATLAAKNDTVHGAHIESGKIVRFEGATYTAGAATNREFPFAYGVTAAFSGAANDIVFTRLDGTTGTPGTTTLTEPRTGATSTIIVYSSGLIEL